MLHVIRPLRHTARLLALTILVNPALTDAASADPALFKRLSSQIAHYKLSGFGRLDVETLDKLATRMRKPPVEDATQRIARTVRHLRCEKGLTQEDLARTSGVALATLRVFEQSGKISLNRLVQLLDALDARDKLEALILGTSVAPKQKPAISRRF